MSDIVNK